LSIRPHLGRREVISGPVNAVVTTGIYCRDGCPASPLPGNVRTYPVDASAEAAGFRPCLRCRPEQRAQPESWDAPDLVADALNEICAGVLDYSTEVDLARRCGVSGRHLRRLFVSHIGATPTQVAISRRAHFARRLLDETNLPIAQIAYAAGFGSVRSMNETMRRIFRFTPSELRAKRSQPRRNVTDGGLWLTVPLSTPVEPAFFERLAALRIEGVEAVSDHTYTRTFTLAGNPGIVSISMIRPDAVEVEAHLPRFDRLIELVTHIRRVIRQLDRAVPAWTPAEAAVKVYLNDLVGPTRTREILQVAAQRFGTILPIPLLGLTVLNADYRSLSDEDWRSLAIQQPARLFDRSDAVTRPTRPAAAEAAAPTWQ
jgi:AraC family transcriptional regulator, regulatory protein of adaptative response / DNA-3-methyladenine glycosylase II